MAAVHRGVVAGRRTAMNLNGPKSLVPPGTIPSISLDSSPTPHQPDVQMDIPSTHSDHESRGSETDSTSQSSSYSDDLWYLAAIQNLPETEHSVVQTELPSTSSASSLGKRKRTESDSVLSSLSDRPTKNRGFRQPATETVWTKGTPAYVINDFQILNSAINGGKGVPPLPWGVQWELARYASSGYKDIDIQMIRKLRECKTNAKGAPEVTALVRQTKKSASADELEPFLSSAELAASSPWNEQDLEDEALKVDPYGLLGFNETVNPTNPNWYGGKVHYVARLEHTRGTDLHIVLDRPRLGPSNRLARRLGSHRILTVQVKDIFDFKGNTLMEFGLTPLVLNSRVFRAWYAHDQNIAYVQTKEVPKIVEGKIVGVVPDPNVNSKEFTFKEVLDLHNKLNVNISQSMTKFASRGQLAMSTSVPGASLKVNCIQVERDIIHGAHLGPGKAPAEMIMTDGCGFATYSLLKHISAKLEWDCIPVAIQFRAAGAKGMLLLDPRDSAEFGDPDEHRIRLRDSQIKIKYMFGLSHYLPPNPDPSLLIIDVLRPARLSTPARLSVETIINLAENGVPPEVFTTLLEEGLRSIVDELTTWDGVDGHQRLWTRVAAVGGVFRARLARENISNARAKGYISEDRTDDDSEDDDSEDDLIRAIQEKSLAWFEDPVSGCPSSLEETVMVLLESGFSPSNCRILRDKLRPVIDRALKSYKNKFRIQVPMSCTAYVVPDPYGVLEPGEVHIKSSQRNLRGMDGRDTDLILGPVLVTRHPCKLPTDVQKVNAVFNYKLRDYVNVIVVSTKGHLYGEVPLHRHLASMTGGGDYDGDTLTAYWHESLVTPFENADPSFATEPPGLSNCFMKVNETVTEFISRVPDDHEEWIREIQRYLLGSLRDPTIVGTYSSMWDNAVYQYGYRSDDAKLMAHMFCSVLDGAKTGIKVDPAILQKHKDRFQRGKLKYKMKEQLFGIVSGNEPFLHRKQGLPKFIMDILSNKVTDYIGAQRRIVDIRLPPDSDYSSKFRDEDLTRPYEAAKLRAQNCAALEEDLEVIKEHAERVHREWKMKLKAKGPPQKASHANQRKSAFTNLSIEVRQDILRSLSKEFANVPQTRVLSNDEALRLMASYVYIQDIETNHGRSHFPWDVAMRHLCRIKADAIGGSKTVSRAFHSKFSIRSTHLRTST